MPRWDDKEIKIINEVELFRLKASIMKKAEGWLIEFKDNLIKEISETGLILPPGTDISKGQIVRGENLKGFPYISLDMPQKFSKEEMFTNRTIFWWGHYLIFSFILKGKNLPFWSSNIVKRKSKAKNIYFSLSAAPWEWELNEQSYCLIPNSTNEEIESAFLKNQHIKLARFYPISCQEFQSLDWNYEGIKTFRDMVGLFIN